MSEAKNIPAFKALIEKYEGITIDEINMAAKEFKNLYHEQFWYKDSKYHPSGIMELLTGYGTSNCTLCIACDHNCAKCVYGGILACVHKPMQETYDAIASAKTRSELLVAVKNRAKAMRKLAKSKGIEL